MKATTIIQANHFIMECTMMPIRRFGVDTCDMNVYRNGRCIGYYDPNLAMFKPIDKWKITFSKGLKENLGLINTKEELEKC